VKKGPRQTGVMGPVNIQDQGSYRKGKGYRCGSAALGRKKSRTDRLSKKKREEKRRAGKGGTSTSKAALFLHPGGREDMAVIMTGKEGGGDMTNIPPKGRTVVRVQGPEGSADCSGDWEPLDRGGGERTMESWVS